MGIPKINPLHWGYRGTIKQYIGEKGTIDLRLKGEGGKLISLDEFVSRYVPGFRHNNRFNLSSYLFTGILQTLYIQAGNFENKFKIYYGREIMKFSDGGVASLDWVFPEWEDRYIGENGELDKKIFREDEIKLHPPSWPRLHPRTRFMFDEELSELRRDNRPLIIIQHGLGGGSHEPIVRAVVSEILKYTESKFNIVVLIARGCGRSKITTKSLFSALSTNDMREFINREHKRKPKKKIYCIGISFGAAILGNYLGEEGTKCPIAGAVCLGCPWDMSSSARLVAQDFWSKRIFAKPTGNYLARIVKVNMAELEFKSGDKIKQPASREYPSNYVYTKDNIWRSQGFSSILEFDNTFTAPSMGFRNAHAYYRIASPCRRLKNISVPTVIINSLDDPIVGSEAIPYTQAQGNPNVLLLTTDIGGHLAYLDTNLNPWIAIPIAQFLYKLNELVQ